MISQQIYALNTQRNGSSVGGCACMCHQQFFTLKRTRGGFKFWGKSIQLHLKSGTPDSLSRTGLTETRGNNTYW